MPQGRFFVDVAPRKPRWASGRAGSEDL